MSGFTLITGATGGIGTELCRVFASHGHNLIITSASEDKLKALGNKLSSYGVEIVTVSADLSKPDGAIDLYGFTNGCGYEVEILVNNAGLGACGEAQSIPRDRDNDIISVNITSATSLTKLYIADMYKRSGGRILNVCSVGAFQPGPYTAAYYASKAYLYSYTRAVRYEARGRGVSVCALCPGPVDTEFFARAGASRPRGAMTAAAVAKCAYKGLMKNRGTVVPGFYNKLARLVPVKIKTAFVAALKRN